MTVEEILAAEMYTDRRGRTWHYLDTIVDYDRWQRWEHYSAEDLILEVSEMRLLIERDMHRDACDGLYNCGDHPVPVVEIDGPVISRTGCYYVRAPKSRRRVGHKHDLESAMDAARALAVTGE